MAVRTYLPLMLVHKQSSIEHNENETKYELTRSILCDQVLNTINIHSLISARRSI